MFSGSTWTIGAATAAAALLWALYAWGPTAATLEGLADQLRGQGVAGGVAFVVAYGLAAAAMFPATPFPLTAGFLWGPYWGFLVAWTGEVIGALLSFALGRTLFRHRAERLSETYPLIGALGDAVDEGGMQLLLLLRLSPVLPFGVLNYSLGVTPVRPLQFAISTIVGVIPASILLAYAGASLTRLADAISGDAPLGWGETLLTWGGLAATTIVVITISRATRRALDRRLNA
jgi:uncharacterized membrane protein YdjX (TVP38/TMEM64 family)